MRERSHEGRGRPDHAQTEEIGVLRSPGLAETLPPSGLFSAMPLAAGKDQLQVWPGSPATTEAGTPGLSQLERLTALVDREVRKSGPVPGAPVTPAAAAKPADSSEEEPLEAYLSRFMQRLTGKQNDQPAPITETVPTFAAAPSQAAVPAESSQSGAAAAPASPAAPPAATREPSKPPECREALQAMRELANHNARSAVAHHATTNLSGRVRLVFVAATGMSLISCGLAAGALAMNSPGCLWGSVIAAGLAALAAGRFFLLCRQFQPGEGLASEVQGG